MPSPSSSTRPTAGEEVSKIHEYRNNEKFRHMEKTYDTMIAMNVQQGRVLESLRTLFPDQPEEHYEVLRHEETEPSGLEFLETPSEADESLKRKRSGKPEDLDKLSGCRETAYEGKTNDVGAKKQKEQRNKGEQQRKQEEQKCKKKSKRNKEKSKEMLLQSQKQ